MIGGEQSVDLVADVDAAWRYLSRFENWAEYVVGFRSLETVSKTRTVWTLRGDVGVLAREVKIQVDLVEEVSGQVAKFTLQGLSEQLTGEGSYAIQDLDGADADADADADGSARAGSPSLQRPSRWKRLLFRLITRLSGRKDRRARRPADPAEERSVEDRMPVRTDERAQSRLTFTLQIDVGGAMAPMIEMLMSPLLQPAADDICRQIATALRGQHANN